MSVDLTINPAIESSPNPVEDQQQNTSQLYLATGSTAIATDKPADSTSLTVYAPPNIAALATVRPDDQRRWHWKGMIGDQRIFTIRTEAGAFQIWVNNKKRLTIDSSGNITLSVDGKLTFEGLSQLSGPNVVDMVIDKSTGEVGHQ